MDIGNYISKGTVPILKHICELKNITVKGGASKNEIILAMLEFIGDDKDKEEEIRKVVEELKRDKTNKVRLESDKSKKLEQLNKRNTDQPTSLTCTPTSTPTPACQTTVAAVGQATCNTTAHTDSHSQQDLFEEVEETKDTSSNDSRTTDVSDTGTVVVVEDDVVNEGGNGMGDVGKDQDVRLNLKPKSTSSALESRSESESSITESESGSIEDGTLDDRAIMAALTGQDLLDDSVFPSDIYMDDSHIQGKSEEMSWKGVPVKNQNGKGIEDKIDVIISIVEKTNVERGKEREEREKERKETRNHIAVLETTSAQLKEINEKAMKTIQEMMRAKVNDMETIKNQANSMLTIAKELKDERVKNSLEREQYAKDMAEIKTSLRKIQQDKEVKIKTSVENGNETSGSKSKKDRVEPSLSGENRKIILVVGDSNTNNIIQNQLHHQKEVRKLKRGTIKEAADNVPGCDRPLDVTDIVINIGVNDMRKGATPKEVRDQTFKLQSKYCKTFKNARFHLTALPPNGKPKEDAGSQLRELAQSTGCNFISLKGLKDKNTKKLRANMLQTDGVHYTEVGVKILAKEIKRSLYSNANMPTGGVLCDLSKLQQTVSSITSQNQ